MGIIYILSVLALLIAFILFKKNDKKIDLISFLCISVVTLFCYNTFICYILTFFTIPITLTLLSIINIFLVSLMVLNIIKKKEIQKYTFNKTDIIYIVLTLIIVLCISYFYFGYPFNVNYETGDASVHFLTATMFAKSDALLSNGEWDPVYGGFSVRKAASYVNSGLIMKCICNVEDTLDCYNVFVGFDIFVLFLTGVTIYSAMKNSSQNKEHLLIAFILSVICMLGYPLNSFLFGFEYLSMGLLIICAIIGFVSYYHNNILKFEIFVFIMTLLNFGLFCSYYFFVPVVYPALWIYFCIMEYMNTKKIITKKLIIILCITLLVPFILGYIYHMAPKLYSVIINNNSKNNLSLDSVVNYSGHIINEGLKTDGYIYINLYSNMLLFIPLTAYLFIKYDKNKKLKDVLFIGLFLTFTLAFLAILLLGYKCEKISIYYLSKVYFVLWIILIYCNCRALILISQKNKILPRILVGTYVTLMIILISFSYVRVEYWYENIFETPLSVMEIFGANKTVIFDKPTEFNQEELEIFKYARENLDFNTQIELVEDEQPNYWAYVLLNYINEEEETKKFWGQNKLNIKRFLVYKKINKVDYIIYFKKSLEYEKLKDLMFYNSEIIFENEAGGILKYKK